MPKMRKYVDVGSALFSEVVMNVPMLDPRFHAMVTREVREQSLAAMQGRPSNEDSKEAERENRLVEGESGLGERQVDAGGQEEARQEVRSRAFKRRKLYKQESGDEVPWFPHDNDMHVLKELCWESGPGVRLVIHGTPAGGAGVQGCLDYGCSVVSLCYGNFHKTHMLKHIVERAMECTVTGNCLLFRDEVIQSRKTKLFANNCVCCHPPRLWTLHHRLVALIVTTERIGRQLGRAVVCCWVGVV